MWLHYMDVQSLKCGVWLGVDQLGGSQSLNKQTVPELKLCGTSDLVQGHISYHLRGNAGEWQKPRLELISES
jgi:hypothetical protein